MLKVKLNSDFTDYYDQWFDRDGYRFGRLSTQGANRENLLKAMMVMGFAVPTFGKLFNIKEKLLKQKVEKVVVYLDENAHRGEGKVLMPLDEALEVYPTHLSSEYIPPSGSNSNSYRYLQVGSKHCWLKYSSQDWRSNCGNVDIKILKAGEGYHEKIKKPLFAIDFVQGDKPYAIDYNSAPCVKGTGIEAELLPRRVFELIQESIQRFNQE